MPADRKCWDDVEVRSVDDAERRCRREATWLTGMQQFDRYTGASILTAHYNLAACLTFIQQLSSQKDA